MKLFDYTQLRRGAASALAASVGVAPALISQWASGQRPVAPERAVDIEQATAGAVMRWDLRPLDWHRIWPELLTRPDAPPMPGSSAHTAAAEGTIAQESA